MLPKRAVAAFFLVLGGLSLATVDRTKALERMIEILSTTEEMGVTGMVLYVGAFVLATLLFVPTAPLDMAAGFLFSRRYGIYVAAALAAVGKQASGSAAFLLGRTTLRQYVHDKLLPRFPIFKAVASAVETDAFKMTCMVRFAPIPTVAKGLCLAASGVPFPTFFAASGLLALPWSVAGAVAGSTLASLPELLDGRGERQLKALISSWKARPGVAAVAALLCVLACIYFWRKVQDVRQLYRDILASQEHAQGADAGSRSSDKKK